MAPRCAGLLKNNPYLNEVIEAKDRVPLSSFLDHWKIVSELKKRSFDTAVFFHRSKTKMIWAWLAGIPERAGYAGLGREKLLTRVIPDPGDRLHRTDHFLKLLHELGISGDGRVPDFYPKKEAEAELKDLLSLHGITVGQPYAVVHAGGNWSLKRWPAVYFVKWAKLFLERYPWKIILCGTESEEALSREISSHFASEEVVSFCGKTSIDMLALLLKNARILLSNDSGPIHLAASQGTRLVGLFGPTSPELTGPVSKGSSLILSMDVGCEVPCYYRSCDYRICMDWLKPEEVFERTAEFLN